MSPGTLPGAWPANHTAASAEFTKILGVDASGLNPFAALFPSGGGNVGPEAGAEQSQAIAGSSRVVRSVQRSIRIEGCRLSVGVISKQFGCLAKNRRADRRDQMSCAHYLDGRVPIVAGLNRGATALICPASAYRSSAS
jgi:hypothetical protein